MEKSVVVNNRNILLTDSEYAIFEILQKDPYIFSASTATEISNRYQVSQSSISRFCQKLGFSGFSEFRLSAIAENLFDDHHIEKNLSFSTNIAEVSKIIEQNIKKSDLQQIIQQIVRARTVYTNGYASSGLAAKTLSFNLALYGKFSMNIEPSSETETLRIMNGQDVVILFSMSNPSHKDFFSILKDLKPAKRPFIVLISGTAKHPFSKNVDMHIALPYTAVSKYTQKITSNIIFNLASYLITLEYATAVADV